MIDFAYVCSLYELYLMLKQIHLKITNTTCIFKKKLLPARFSGIETTPRVTPNRADSKKP